MPDFLTLVPPIGLAGYVDAAGLTLVRIRPQETPWALMYARREADGRPFAALSAETLTTEQLERCVATAIAHSVLDHHGDFVYASDGTPIVAADESAAAEAIRYGALLIRS